MKRKTTAYLLIPLVFVVSVIGLFFVSTDQSTWPQSSTSLGAWDTELASAASTVWCESVILTSSEHDFVAYKLSSDPVVNPLSLNRQVIELNAKLDRRRLNKLERSFYLLPGSIIRITVCATVKQAHLYVYKGIVTRDCLNLDHQSDSQSDESDERERDELAWTRGDTSQCPSMIRSEDVPLVSAKMTNCVDYGGARSLDVNVTSPGKFDIILAHEGLGSNDVRLRLILDRANYHLEQHTAANMCATYSPCVVPLTFASRERILLWIPPEPDAGKTTYVIRSQCRPRIAVFAFLVVLLPVALFVIIAFVLRSRVRRSSSGRSQTARRGTTNSDGGHWGSNFASPLLPPTCNGAPELPRRCSTDLETEEMTTESHLCHHYDGDPPPYDCVCASSPPPPAYSSLSQSSKEISFLSNQTV